MSNDLTALASPEWDGCARVIYSPDTLMKSGFSQESVDATTEIMESNLSDPWQTIYGPDGKPVAQMRGVVFYSLAVHIARKYGLEWDCAWGLNTNVRRIQEAARQHLAAAEQSG